MAPFVFLAQAWITCTLVGIAVLTPLRRAWRSLWLPAAPAVGAAFLICALHATTLIVGVGIGIYLALALSLIPAGVGWGRGQRPWQVDQKAWLSSGLVTACGLFGAALALLPNVRAGSARVVLSSWSNDVIFYVSESAWFRGHTLLETPHVATEVTPDTASPLFGSASQAMGIPLRIGQALLASGLQHLWGVDDINGFAALMATWVLLGAGGIFVGARLLGFGVVAGTVAALLSCSSAVLVRAAFDQHADSLLGMALVVPTVAGFLVAVLRRQPMLPAVVLLAGLMGCYTEYFAIIVPGCMLGVAVSGSARSAGSFTPGWRAWGKRLLRAIAVVGCAVALAPVAWLRGVRSLMIDYYTVGFFPSPFITESPLLSLSRALGMTGVDSGVIPLRSCIVIAAVITIGLALTALLSRYRYGLLGTVGAGLSMSALATVQNRGYLQDRLVTLSLPLVIWCAVGGWALAIRALSGFARIPGLKPRGQRWTRVALAATGLCLAIAGLALTANVRTTSVVVAEWSGSPRAVGEQYDDVQRWVDDLGGVDGTQVTVVVPDLFQQFWVLYALRDQRNVSYLSLHHDYVVNGRYWNGEVDRYLLVGPGVPATIAPGAVIRSNDLFRLVDTSVGRSVVLAPTDMPYWAEYVADGQLSAGTQSQLVALRSPAAPDTVEVPIRSDGTDPQVALVGPGGPAEVNPETGRATVALTGPTTDLTITTGREVDRGLLVGDPVLP